MRTFKENAGRREMEINGTDSLNGSQGGLGKPARNRWVAGRSGAMRAKTPQRSRWLQYLLTFLMIMAGTLYVMQAVKAEPLREGAAYYRSPVSAYRLGIKAYMKGDMAQALSALKYAASKGIIPARLNLARIYMRGQGVRHNPKQAFQQLRLIADRYADISPSHPASRYVATAFVELGKFHRRGEPSMGLEPDDSKAADYFVHAANLFGDPEAQYQLARLYLQGAGVRKNVRLARHWLVSASKKRYAPAQAYLAQLLWQGRVLKRRPVKAIVLSTLAVANARPEDREWISVIHRSILDDALPRIQKRARAVVAKWRRAYGPRSHAVDASSRSEAKVLNVREKARGIDVRPYTPGEGTEGDRGQILALPAASGHVAKQNHALASRVREAPVDPSPPVNRLRVLQGSLGGGRNSGPAINRGFREIGTPSN